jgi:hypothetical protein
MMFAWKAEARYRLRGMPIWDRFMAKREQRLERDWAKRGRFGPPHIVKQEMLLSYANEYGVSTLVETGTYLGDMVYAMKDKFSSIYSIELNEGLHQRAKQTLAKYPHIHLALGDSATMLENVLKEMNDRCIFWLDGHYSGGITSTAEEWCPLRGELKAILQHPVKDHIILIDDAICFDGNNGYPTLWELHDLVTSRMPNYEIKVFDNIIQLVPSFNKSKQ